MFLRPALSETKITVWDLKLFYFMTVSGLRLKIVKNSLEQSGRVEGFMISKNHQNQLIFYFVVKL